MDEALPGFNPQHHLKQPGGTCTSGIQGHPDTIKATEQNKILQTSRLELLEAEFLLEWYHIIKFSIVICELGYVCWPAWDGGASENL